MSLVEILSVSAAWVGAFGTTGAVGVALWLASRSTQVRLKVNVAVYYLVNPGRGATEHLGFFVTNLGERPVTINTLGWRTGRPRHRRHGVVSMLAASSPDTFPATLAHGQQATFLIIEKDSDAWLTAYFAGILESARPSTLRGAVTTTVGRVHFAKPAAAILDALRKRST